MKKLFILSMLVFLFGCHAAVHREISARSTSQRTDVFREISKESDVPRGSAGLLIKAEIKTHHEGYYILESKKSFHGKPKYPIVINIDGQSITWEMPGVQDDTARYDDRGQITPEGGKGVKYSIEKWIALSPGRHNLSVVLPGDDYIKEMEVTLPAESRNVLELSPVYIKGGVVRHRNFLYEIKNFSGFLNGREVTADSSSG